MRPCLWLVRFLGALYSILLVALIVFPSTFSFLQHQNQPQSEDGSSVGHSVGSGDVNPPVDALRLTKNRGARSVGMYSKRHRKGSFDWVKHSSSNSNSEIGSSSKLTKIDKKTKAKGKNPGKKKSRKQGKKNKEQAREQVQMTPAPVKHTRSNVRSKVRSFECIDNLNPQPWVGQRGPFWVLYNHVRATRTFACDESITYTTHADYSFLDNLLPLVDRWRGPVSLSLFTPGWDYAESMRWIRHLRQCSPLVKEYVTFHIFFDGQNIPNVTNLLKPDKYLKTGRGLVNLTDLEQSGANATSKMKQPSKTIQSCSASLSFKLAKEMGPKIKSYRTEKKLLYPVNVARNIARDMATTHYVFAADIELYPSPNLVPSFLTMIRRDEPVLHGKKPKVFVVPVFEVDKKIKHLPRDKVELLRMLHNKTAVPFHKYVCRICHAVPGQDKWLNNTDSLNSNLTQNHHHNGHANLTEVKVPSKGANEVEPFKIIHVGKRADAFGMWEPFYIGTKMDPIWDERLTWEGRSNKMTQAYIMCVLDYDFMILDKAFLVHRPGIKWSPKRITRIVNKQSSFIKKVILPEMNLLYGRRRGCRI